MEDNKKALEYAGKALSYRMLSEKQLFDKIIAKGFSEESAEYAVEMFKKYGGINDEEYCDSLIRTYKAKGYGKRRIVQKLKESGIQREMSDEKLENFEPDYSKMQKYISSKIKTENPDRQTVKKVFDGLLRKGFSYEQVKEALNKFLNEEEYYE
ncbi:MAG: regulatory protein RecX [Clostridia bacterium]|nr:regulatory protein RecX [Clostridia bacterium]